MLYQTYIYVKQIFTKENKAPIKFNECLLVIDCNFNTYLFADNSHCFLAKCSLTLTKEPRANNVVAAKSF